MVGKVHNFFNIKLQRSGPKIESKLPKNRHSTNEPTNIIFTEFTVLKMKENEGIIWIIFDMYA